MRIRLLAPVLVLAATFAAAPRAFAQTQKNLTYTSGPGGTERGDLYEPTGAGPFPGIVYLHGGSWRSGNKSSFHRLATDLAAQGYVGSRWTTISLPAHFRFPGSRHARRSGLCARMRPSTTWIPTAS